MIFRAFLLYLYQIGMLNRSKITSQELKYKFAICVLLFARLNKIIPSTLSKLIFLKSKRNLDKEQKEHILRRQSIPS